MRKKVIIVSLISVTLWVLFGLWLANAYKPDSAVQGVEQIMAEETPEQLLIGIWQQTQEYLNYENTNVHSENVTVTDKGSLEFRSDGTCEARHPYMETTVFSFEQREGEVLLVAEGWATLRYLLVDNTLIDPETNIAKYEKQ